MCKKESIEKKTEKTASPKKTTTLCAHFFINTIGKKEGERKRERVRERKRETSVVV
jgi:hypothetical protein